jgi:hypothetical protein
MEISRCSIINDLFIKYNLINPIYLEIGVWHGNTFKNVKSLHKDGVDPGQYCESDYVNYKMTSDDFFNYHNKKKYDFIFIDGLHTAYQVSKDIYNSIASINEGGIIMLDDVFPHCKREQEALDLNKSGAQSGDVWKSVYDNFSIFEEICDEILFFKNSERGNLILKIKKKNVKNIVIDASIPMKNVDGWYKGNDKEWLKYDYDKDFNNYLYLLHKYIVKY